MTRSFFFIRRLLYIQEEAPLSVWCLCFLRVCVWRREGVLVVISDVGGLCNGCWNFYKCNMPKWYACGAGFCWVKRLMAELRNLLPCPDGRQGI